MSRQRQPDPYILASRVLELLPGHLGAALDNSPAEDVEAVIRVLRRGQAVREVNRDSFIQWLIDPELGK